MKEVLIFPIVYPEALGNSNADVVIRDRITFDKIRSLAPLTVDGKNPNYKILRIDNADPNLEIVLKLIEQQTGRRPARSRQEGNDASLAHSVFPCRVEREYSRDDIIDAPLLRLRATKELAYPAPNHHPEKFAVCGDEKLKNTKWDFGYVFWCEGLVCSDHLRQQLESKKIKGIEFKPVSVITTKNTNYRQLWQISSRVILPPLLLPLAGKDGRPYKGPLTDEPDCQGCFVQENNISKHHHYRFSRSDIEKLGDFDVALTQERFGSWDVSAYRSVIVSQRWREVFEYFKIPEVEFLPVFLT